MSYLPSDATKLAINCCTVNAAGRVASGSDQGSLTSDLLYRTVLQGFQNEIIREYVTDVTTCPELSDVSDAIQALTSKCGCAECVDADTTIVLPPGVFALPVYFGNSDQTSLNAAAIEALDSESKTTFAGNYDFPLVDPDEYSYLAYPSQWGVQTRIYDPATGFDIAIDDPTYTVVINSITYTVLKTFFPLGGGFTATLTL